MRNSDGMYELIYTETRGTRSNLWVTGYTEGIGKFRIADDSLRTSDFRCHNSVSSGSTVPWAFVYSRTDWGCSAAIANPPAAYFFFRFDTFIDLNV
jgi:hypothetical protein